MAHNFLNTNPQKSIKNCFISEEILDFASREVYCPDRRIAPRRRKYRKGIVRCNCANGRPDCGLSGTRRSSLAPLALQSTHSASRHDARCRCAGADRVGGQ